MRCLVPTLAAQFVQSQQPLVVGSPSAVTVCPAPALAVQGVGRSLLYLLAMGSVLRHSVTLASCRTLSFCYFSRGFLPLAFIQAWV